MTVFTRCSPLWPLMVLSLLLCGCAASGGKPVVDWHGESSPAGKVKNGSYRVQQGDTLYSIAWRFGWDYRQLARLNKIPSPYTIYPGQVLRFARQGSASGESTASSGGAVAIPVDIARADAVKPVARSEQQLADQERQANDKQSSAVADKPTSKPAEKHSTPPSTNKETGPPQWQWPAQGDLKTTFGDGGAAGRGIAITGRLGSPITAAAGGQVVYRGSGLTGYGKMIIIKHNSHWLSAYAHNKDILVAEGQQVKGGQQIATMGASGTYRTELHFEIRKDGKPVDPRTVLPKR